MNTELLLQTIQSVYQLSIYAAVAIWCYQCGSTEQDKGRARNLVDKKILTKLKLEEVQLLVSLPTLATGNRMRENVLSF